MRDLYIIQTPRARQKGMTLIELMVSTIILAILVSAAVPGMKSLFERKSIFAIGDFFIKSMQLARIEAIQRSQTVTVITESGTGDWSQGWRFEALDINGNIEVIKRFPPLPSSPIFTSAVYDGSPNLLVLPTGQVNTVGTFDMYYPDCTGDQRLSFDVLLSGLMKRGVSVCP